MSISTCCSTLRQGDLLFVPLYQTVIGGSAVGGQQTGCSCCLRKVLQRREQWWDFISNTDSSWGMGAQANEGATGGTSMHPAQPAAGSEG